MSKQYNNGSSLNEKILKGMNVLADNVGTTLGPKGRNVILYDRKQNIPVITKDGVTIAKFVELEDPLRMSVFKFSSKRQSNLQPKLEMEPQRQLFLHEESSMKHRSIITSGRSPIELKRGMDKACEVIVEKIKEHGNSHSNRRRHLPCRNHIS